MYKLKGKDDESLKLKARIKTPENENSEKENVHTMSCLCPPLGVHAVSSTDTTRKFLFLVPTPKQPSYKQICFNVMFLCIHRRNLCFAICHGYSFLPLMGLLILLKSGKGNPMMPFFI